MADSTKERQKRYFDSQRAKGLHQVRIWVPVELTDDVKELVEKFCRCATKKETKDA